MSDFCTGFGHKFVISTLRSTLLAIALYLDVDQFLAEMASDCHTARIQTDIESGAQSGVIKTPTFFINGLKYSDDPHLEKLLEAIMQASYE
jgi:protein-disulfide isomerase